jgi:hypothetical protein
MANSRVYFHSVNEELESLLENENIALNREYINSLMEFLSIACNYEEESNKIRPRLLIAKDLDSLLHQVPNSYKLKIHRGSISGEDFKGTIKSIIPFCKNGWMLYIDTKFSPNYFEYGVVRSFSGPQGLSFTELLFEGEESNDGIGLIDLEVISNFEINLRGIFGHSLVIDFRIVDNQISKDDETIDQISKAVTKDVYDDEEKSILERTFKNLFKVASQRIHGTICIVSKHGMVFPNDLLKDGIWLESPIDLSSEVLIATKTPSSDPNLRERYYGLTGLFIEMLNLDGITVLNTKGQIIGYNVFIRDTDDKEGRVSGGARRRAAHSLAEKGKDILEGVYFQSQDGYSYFKEVSESE